MKTCKNRFSVIFCLDEKINYFTILFSSSKQFNEFKGHITGSLTLAAMVFPKVNPH